MAWTYNNKVVREGRSWKDDNEVTHPTGWGRWTDEYKVQMGLVFKADPEPFDSRFYYAAGVPKPLNELVAQAIKQTKVQELSLLSKTDWMVIKSVEVETYGMPDGVVTFRAAVRAESERRAGAFAACKSVDQIVETTQQQSVWPETYDE